MHLLLLSALLLTASPDAGPPLEAPELRPSEGLPAGFRVDGKLDEWKGPPTLTLGPSSQVAGGSRVASPEDFSAKVWLAVGLEGLALAGEVRDDRVLPSTRPAELNADHVEVWLALPAPRLPPLAYANQFGETELATAEDCGKNSLEDVEGCREWWKEQALRRKHLSRAFVAQYALSSAGGVRLGQDVKLGPVRFEPVPGGYRFEALVPATAFPRALEAPLAHVRVLVDVVDNDEGRVTQESFLSSSPTRRFGDPATFHAVTLATPLRYGAWPELLERALSEVELGGAASYQPGPGVNAFQVWLNRMEPYQYSPGRPSPEVFTVELGPVKVLARQGDVELLTVPAGLSALGEPLHWVLTRRGRRILEVQTLSASDELRTAVRGGVLYLLQAHSGPYREGGHGMCGSCDTVSVSLWRIGRDGTFTQVLSDGAGGPPDVPVELEWKASRDLSSVEVHSVLEGDNGKRTHVVSRHTYNPKTGEYEHSTRRSSTSEKP